MFFCFSLSSSNECAYKGGKEEIDRERERKKPKQSWMAGVALVKELLRSLKSSVRLELVC